jgi:hypothetical protein
MATPSSCVQIALEESPRYENAATTTPYRIGTDVAYLPITSVNLTPDPQWIDRSDEVRAIEGGVPQLIDTYQPAGNISVRNYPNSLPWLLACSGFTLTKTAGDGTITDPDSVAVPVGVTKWVATKRSGVTARTMQILQNFVDQGVFIKGQGFGVSGLSLNSAGEISADLMGLVYLRTADPNVTPSYDTQAIPFGRRGDITLTWLSGSGTTDDFSLAIANSLIRHRSMGVATYYPDTLSQGDDRVKLTGSIPKYSLATADIDALLAGTTFAAKARWVLPKNVGATNYPYKIYVEMPSCQYTGGGPEALANKRRHGGSFDFWAAWDEASGFDVKITVLCSVTSIGAPFLSSNVGV